MGQESTRRGCKAKNRSSKRAPGTTGASQDNVTLEVRLQMKTTNDETNLSRQLRLDLTFPEANRSNDTRNISSDKKSVPAESKPAHSISEGWWSDLLLAITEAITGRRVSSRIVAFVLLVVAAVPWLASMLLQESNPQPDRSAFQRTESVFRSSIKLGRSLESVCGRDEVEPCRTGLIQSAALMKAAADGGHHNAQFRFGLMACLGWGTEKNPYTAKLYLDRAQLSGTEMEIVYREEAFRTCYMSKLA
jgi:TPR repeat protein